MRPCVLSAQRRFVGVAFAALEPTGVGFVLNDVVIPINDPHGAVRPDFGGDGRRPFVVAGEKVVRVVGEEIRAVGIQIEPTDEMAGRLGDECDAVQYSFG